MTNSEQLPEQQSDSSTNGRTKPAWNRFVEQHPQHHFLQLQQWGHFKEYFGWQSSTVFTSDSEGAIRSGSLVLYRPLIAQKPFHQLPTMTIGYVPKGPLVDWHDGAAVQELLDALEKDGRQNGAGILKIEPELPDTEENRALLYEYGFHPSGQTVQPRSTIHLDISGTEEAIMGQMKSKWRYNIRLAQRKGVTVRQGSIDDLVAFNELMQTTGARNDFFVHEPAYYRTAFQLFSPDYAAFFFAEYEGQPLAAVAIFVVGQTAWYPWGASSNHERNRMPNYALHWSAMRWAKAQGATMYDFWGIPDPIGGLAMSMPTATEAGIPALTLPIDLQNLPSGELWGVYRLKQGFGGNVIRYVGAWDRPIHPLGYRLYQWALTLRQRLARSPSGQTHPDVPLLPSSETINTP
ncbi:MAG: peptidoglycan bridge formation glycyltransferase FemA/FemB family protein [Chloroflexota bacterium]